MVSGIRAALHDRLEDDPLWAEAASWYIEVRSNGVSPERLAAWLSWLEEDAQHQKAFDGIVSLARQGRQFDALWPSEDEVAADSYDGEESISSWREGSRGAAPAATVASPPSFTRRRNLAIAAACALVALGVLGYRLGPALSALLQQGQRDLLITKVGQMRTLMLPDGSLVTAGGDTALTAVVLKHSRRLTLDHGEIFLRVAKDRSRPFTVVAGATAVTAVGTAFDVRRVRSESVVAVAEGIVRVSAAAGVAATAPIPADGLQDGRELLRAGQQWRLDSTEGAAELSAVDPQSVAGWREGRLQYLDEPLQLIVSDLARYSSTRIILKDARVAHMRMTGVVFLHDLEAWLSSLELSLPVRVVHTRDGRIEIEQQ